MWNLEAEPQGRKSERRARRKNGPRNLLWHLPTSSLEELVMLAEKARTMILRAPICLDDRHLARSGQFPRIRRCGQRWMIGNRKWSWSLPDDPSRLGLEDRSTIHSGPIGPTFRFHVIFWDPSTNRVLTCGTLASSIVVYLRFIWPHVCTNNLVFMPT